MLKSKKNIQYELSQTTFEAFIDELECVKGIEGVTAVIDPLRHDFSDEQWREIGKICELNIDLIIIEDTSFAVKIRANGVLISDFESDLNAIRTAHPNWIVGGRATSMTHCKNWELLKVDYIELRPPATKKIRQILGAEPFSSIIPKEEQYGWMILSLNVPVIGTGVSNYSELEKIVAQADLAGIKVSTYFEPNDERKACLGRISQILG